MIKLQESLLIFVVVPFLVFSVLHGKRLKRRRCCLFVSQVAQVNCWLSVEDSVVFSNFSVGRKNCRSICRSIQMHVSVARGHRPPHVFDPSSPISSGHFFLKGAWDLFLLLLCCNPESLYKAFLVSLAFLSCLCNILSVSYHTKTRVHSGERLQFITQLGLVILFFLFMCHARFQKNCCVVCVHERLVIDPASACCHCFG